jgi:hypothetical protein
MPYIRQCCPTSRCCLCCGKLGSFRQLKRMIIYQRGCLRSQHFQSLGAQACSVQQRAGRSANESAFALAHSTKQLAIGSGYRANAGAEARTGVLPDAIKNHIQNLVQRGGWMSGDHGGHFFTERGSKRRQRFAVGQVRSRDPPQFLGTLVEAVFWFGGRHRRVLKILQRQFCYAAYVKFAGLCDSKHFFRHDFGQWIDPVDQAKGMQDPFIGLCNTVYLLRLKCRILQQPIDGHGPTPRLPIMAIILAGLGWKAEAARFISCSVTDALLNEAR